MARFRHPIKVKLSKEELFDLMKKHGSQRAVSEFLGVSQMSVQRALARTGVKFDGRIRANANSEKTKSQSERMKLRHSLGEIAPYWKGKTRSLESIEAHASKMRGRPSWNTGLAHVNICEGCGAEFKAPKKKNRRFCGRPCAAIHMKRLYSDGRWSGTNNPNFGNDKLKETWRKGAFDDRKPIRHGRGIGGFHNGIWMRSSWELAFAKALDEKGIAWTYEKRKFKLSNGKRYLPDFFLPELNLLIEIKGYWYPQAKEKFELFRTEFPEEKIIVIGKELWNPILNV